MAEHNIRTPEIRPDFKSSKASIYMLRLHAAGLNNNVSSRVVSELLSRAIVKHRALTSGLDVPENPICKTAPVAHVSHTLVDTERSGFSWV